MSIMESETTPENSLAPVVRELEKLGRVSIVVHDVPLAVFERAKYVRVCSGEGRMWLSGKVTIDGDDYSLFSADLPADEVIA